MAALTGGVSDISRAFHEISRQNRDLIESTQQHLAKTHQHLELISDRQGAPRAPQDDEPSWTAVRSALEIFNGNADKLDEWLFKLDLLLPRAPLALKIRTAKFRLSGDALAWAQEPAAQAAESNWDGWISKLKGRFGVIDRVLKARRELFTLRQEGSLREYTAKFSALSVVVELDESSKVFQYVNGLEAPLRARVYEARATTFDAAVLAADTIDSARLLGSGLEAAPVSLTTEEFPEQVNAVKYSNRGRPAGRGFRPKNSSEPQCQQCFRHGHVTRDCFRPPRCDQCGGGHQPQQCPFPSRRSSSNALVPYNSGAPYNAPNSYSSRSPPRCYVCDQQGHIARDCPRRQGNGNAR